MPKIPEFKSDIEAAEFFDTHSMADYWDDMEPVEEVIINIPRMAKSLVTLPISQNLLKEIKQIANERGLPYQTLVRQWLAEKVNQERTAGEYEPEAV